MATDITVDDFMSGVLAELALHGEREIALDDQVFDQRCQRAFQHLREVAPALGLGLRFVIVLHPFHHDSPVVRTALAEAGQRGLIGPGDGPYRLRIRLSDPEARGLLSGIPGGALLYQSLGRVMLSDPGLTEGGRPGLG
jgi:hypothetical protein